MKNPILKKIQKCFLMPLFGYVHTNVKSDLNSAYQIFDGDHKFPGWHHVCF